MLLAFPSFAFVQKYGGLAGVAGYTVAVFLVAGLVARFGWRIKPWLDRHFRILSALCVLFLAAGFVTLHPLEDNRGPGKSSDRNEGLELAVTRMAEGKFPYYPPRVFPGPLSVLPGSILLSAPFVALGNSGYQNILWLALFLAACAWWFNDRALSLWLLVLPLALSPAALYEFISGGDLIANGIFVALFALGTLDSWTDRDAPAWRGWIGCILLGMGLASRANFILLLPLFGAALWRLSGPRVAIPAIALVFLTTTATCLPFYLHNPAGFTPLGSSRKLAIVNGVYPWADVAMIVITVFMATLGAVVLMVRKPVRPVTSFFRWATGITLTPMVCAVLLSSWAHGKPDFVFMHDRFGLMYVFFALLGWGGGWIHPAPEARAC